MMPGEGANIPRIIIGENFFRQINVLETVIEILQMKLSDFEEPLRVALTDIIIPSIETNFAQGGRPAWKPLALPTVVARGWKTGPILHRTGKLYNAVTDPQNWTVTKDMVALTSITSKVKYAGYHQMGAPRARIPARPFVEYQTEDINMITELFGIWVDDIVDQVWGFGEEGPE